MWPRSGSLALGHAVAVGVLAFGACSTREPRPVTAEAEPGSEATSKPGPDQTGDERVEVELGRVSDAAREALAARLGPDSPVARADVVLAVHHQILDGWHIYWRNPGDSGLATRIDVAVVPTGATPGTSFTVLYPGPERFTATGGQVTYGWGHEATLFVALEGVDANSDTQVEVDSRYLACAESCVPGEAKLSAKLDALPVRDDPHTTAMLARVPGPLGPELGAGFTDGALHLRPNSSSDPDAKVEAFFPYASDTAFIGVHERDEAGSGLTVHYRFSGAPPNQPQGVVHATVAGESRWVEIDLAWPGAATP